MRKAGERLAAGMTKRGVSISIDREYVGSKHVTLTLEELDEFIEFLGRLRTRLAERDTESKRFQRTG